MLSVVHREPCIFGPICRGTCLVVTTRLSETWLTNFSALLKPGPASLLQARFGTEERRGERSSEDKPRYIGGNGRSYPRARAELSMNRFRQLAPIDFGSGLEVHSSLLDIVLHE
jgi:hypothetical protein